MKAPSAPFLVALLAAWLSVGQARADYMNWSFSSNAVPPGFSATGANNAGGTVQLTPYTNVAGSSAITALAYQTSATGPATFNAANTAYTLSLTITDNTTHDSGTLTFSGSISGSLSPTTSSLVNTFADPQQSLTLDGHTYTVTLPPTVPLAAPTSPQQNITAQVSVSGAGVQGVPEPTSVVLGSLGICLTALGGWWKGRRRAAGPAT
ncbi:MAG TPA: hypothetical protein VMG10_15870 [Gemmataceae bacterium]|nr:hypothetical protein [Gemmataceae bacterium]